MKKYIFQFDSIRKVKDALEKKAQKEVAIVELEIEGLKNEHRQLEAEKSKFLNNNETSYKVAELQFRHDFCELMDKKMEIITQHIEELEIKKNEKLQDLIQKTKEHKIFNTLDENMKERFIQEQNKIESADIDEIAISKFIRKDK